MPAMRQGVVAQPRGLAQQDACAHACGRGGLRGRELGSDARPYDRRARRLDHSDRRGTASVGQRAEDRRSAGAVHCSHRAGAANRPDAGDRARCHARARAAMGGSAAAASSDHPYRSMIEVMMVGVLVALVKIADYATVIPGVALFVLWVLVFL